MPDDLAKGLRALVDRDELFLLPGGRPIFQVPACHIACHSDPVNFRESAPALNRARRAAQPRGLHVESAERQSHVRHQKKSKADQAKETEASFTSRLCTKATAENARHPGTDTTAGGPAGVETPARASGGRGGGAAGQPQAVTDPEHARPWPPEALSVEPVLDRVRAE